MLSKLGWQVPCLSQLQNGWVFLVSDGPTSDIKTRPFIEINIFIVLVKVKCLLLNKTRFSPKQLAHHQFLKDEFPKSNHSYSTKSQKVGTKTLVKIRNRFVSNRPTFLSLDCCCQRQVYPNFFISSWSISCLVRSLSEYWILKKNIGRFWKIKIRRHWQHISQNKLHNFKWCNIQWSAVMLCPMKCSFLSEWVTGATLHFFINEILNFGTAVIFQTFHLSIH